MRFSDRITFVTISESVYDPSTGDYIESQPIYDTVPCKLSPIKIDRKKELFGELDTRITVARLQRPYTDEFDHIEINNKKMKLKHRSDYRKGVFYLEGDFQ